MELNWCKSVFFKPLTSKYIWGVIQRDLGSCVSFRNTLCVLVSVIQLQLGFLLLQLIQPHISQWLEMNMPGSRNYFYFGLIKALSYCSKEMKGLPLITFSTAVI